VDFLGPSSTGLLSASAEALTDRTAGGSWCDVSVGDGRGWVAGDFLHEEYRRRRVLVPGYGMQIGISIVAFAFGAYWRQHYRSRFGYGEREHWSHASPQYRPVVVHDDRDGRAHGNSYPVPHQAYDEEVRALSPRDNRGRAGANQGGRPATGEGTAQGAAQERF
jgi:uncharacterized protein YraI